MTGAAISVWTLYRYHHIMPPGGRLCLPTIGGQRGMGLRGWPSQSSSSLEHQKQPGPQFELSPGPPVEVTGTGTAEIIVEETKPGPPSPSWGAPCPAGCSVLLHVWPKAPTPMVMVGSWPALLPMVRCWGVPALVKHDRDAVYIHYHSTTAMPHQLCVACCSHWYIACLRPSTS